MADKGRPGPLSAMSRKPEVWSHLTHYWEAFEKLSTCRPQGPTGVGSIPWDAIDRYAERFEYDGPYYDELCTVIAALDGVFLKHQPKPDRMPPKNK